MKYNQKIAGCIMAGSLALVATAANADAAITPAPAIMSGIASQTCGPPDQQTAMRTILAYLNSDSSITKFTSVRIGAGHAAGAGEAMQVQVDLGAIVYPVATTYTTTSGSGPAAYIRDYVAHFYLYQKADGRWDATTNSQPGDGNHLRGT